MKDASKRLPRGITLMAVGMVAGSLLLSPAAAHLNSPLTFSHLKKHFYTKGQSNSRFINVGEKATSAGSADTSTNADMLDGYDSSAYKRIQLPGQAAFFGGGGGSSVIVNPGQGSTGGVRINPTDSTSIAWQFLLPPDHTAGTSLKLRVLMFVPAASCGLSFERNTLSVVRPGAIPFGDHTFITPGQENDITTPGTAGFATEFTIAGTVDGQPLQPGDSLMISVFRQGGDPQDTCAGDLYLHGAEVIYT